jgi:hypothetical protein
LLLKPDAGLDIIEPLRRDPLNAGGFGPNALDKTFFG